MVLKIFIIYHKLNLSAWTKLLRQEVHVQNNSNRSECSYEQSDLILYVSFLQ